MARAFVKKIGSGETMIFNSDIFVNAGDTVLTGLSYFRVPSNLKISRAQVEIFEKGSITSGTLRVDLKKNNTPNNTGMVSLFGAVLANMPTVNFATALDYAVGNGILTHPNNTVNANQIIRIDILSKPANLTRFRITVYGE
jgi:hypothetical protein